MLKGKKLNLGPKMFYFSIFCLEFEKTTVLFEISTFEFVKMQCFMLKEEKTNLLQKIPYFVIFGLEFEKTVVIFEVSTFDFVKI